MCRRDAESGGNGKPPIASEALIQPWRLSTNSIWSIRATGSSRAMWRGRDRRHVEPPSVLSQRAAPLTAQPTPPVIPISSTNVRVAAASILRC
jgi:hypothetical protein